MNKYFRLTCTAVAFSVAAAASAVAAPPSSVKNIVLVHGVSTTGHLNAVTTLALR